MTFDDYQKRAIITDLAPKDADKTVTSIYFFNKILGLVGETGEVAEKFKKVYRDGHGELTPENLEVIKKELGDVLWYISVLSSYMGFSLDDLAEQNLAKLQARNSRGTLSGSGDSR